MVIIAPVVLRIEWPIFRGVSKVGIDDRLEGVIHKDDTTCWPWKTPGVGENFTRLDQIFLGVANIPWLILDHHLPISSASKR